MPAEWTGDFLRDVHLSGLTIKAVAEKAGLNDMYVSQVLHADAPSNRAKEKLLSALEEPKAARAACFTKYNGDKNNHLPPRGRCSYLVIGGTCHDGR